MSTFSRFAVLVDRRSLPATVGAAVNAMPRAAELKVDCLEYRLEIVLPPACSQRAISELDEQLAQASKEAKPPKAKSRHAA